MEKGFILPTSSELNKMSSEELKALSEKIAPEYKIFGDCYINCCGRFNWDGESSSPGPCPCCFDYGTDFVIDKVG
jgi:hypothetical protein